MKFQSFKIVSFMIKIKFFSKKCFVFFHSAQCFYGKREGSGSASVTNGSGRLKNIRILRIRNTAVNHVQNYPLWGFLGLKCSLPA
jgi:hypothetical protein